MYRNPKQEGISNQFKMDVWWNNHFLYKDLESSNWKQSCINGLGSQVYIYPDLLSKLYHN